jgi:hypothetical protein
MIAHNVFFQLIDGSAASRSRLVEACRKHLTGHPGLVSFAAGTIEPELSRPVNDRDFDVSLHLLFESRKAHDDYQDAPRHHAFVEENKAGWAKVRVFDSVVELA